MRPVRTKDCKASEGEKVCHVNLIQDRTADFEASVPELTFKATLGARVHSPTHHALVKAGTPFLLDVTLRNNSRDKRLLVLPIYARLTGNGADGHLQEPGLSVQHFTPEGIVDEVRPSPYLVLQPKQTRSFNVVVRTYASDAFDEEGASPSGGSEVVAEFAPPQAAEIRDGADLAKLTQADLTLLDPGKDVEMKPGSERFRVGVDDSAPPTPPSDWLGATWDITKGTVVGLWRATWGIVRGVFWDLPRLAGKAALWGLNSPFAMVNYEVQLWDSVKDDPALLALYLNPLTNATLVAAKEVPSLVDSAQDLYAKVDQAAYAHFSKLEKEWYAGDWHHALQEYSAEGTEALANIALPAVAVKLAPGILARIPQAAAALQAAKAKVFTEVSARLAPYIGGGTTVADAAAALSTVMKAAVGKTLDLAELEALYGMSAEEASWLARFCKARKLVVTFRSRASQALDWVKKGAVLKPEWIKLKTVNFEDVKYLGYKEADIGRLILKKPASRARFYNDIYPKIPVRERALAAKRWFLRSQEWEVGDGPKMLRWWADRKTPDTTFNWGANLNNPAAAPLEQASSVPFRLARGNRPVGEYVVEVANPKTNQWSSVTGDIDLLAITKADGAPLTDAEHIRVLNEMRDSPLGIQHPETATWNAPEGRFGGLREKYLSNGGKCCAGQFGADGIPRAVQYDPKLSAFRSSENYRAWFTGGYIVAR